MKNRILILLFLSSLAAACGPKSSHAAVPSTFVPYRLQPGELVLAASPEDIPAIQAEEELFVPAQKADLNPEDLIVGIVIGGESRAYPVRLLSLHEVINDRIGDEAFAVTWCPLCYSPVVYEREIHGQELTFQASGYLLHDNLVLMDLQTNTLWSQLLGQGIKGALRGEVLEVLPASITTWAVWVKSYPESRVLDASQLGYKGKLPDPYQGYFSSNSSGLSGVDNIDPRLPGKSLIYGLVLEGEAAALIQEDLHKERLIHFEIAGIPVLAVYHPSTSEGFFYVREARGENLNFEVGDTPDIIRDEETGTHWRISTGISLKGPLKGATLSQIPGQLAFWFAWSSFYPDSELVSTP